MPKNETILKLETFTERSTKVYSPKMGPFEKMILAKLEGDLVKTSEVEGIIRLNGISLLA
jgi:hypothetical protein